MKKMSERLNQVSQEKISILEFVSDGDSSEHSFLKMVESGTKCDGLVISGHHTGSFGGSRVEGTLSVDFMEKLSCDPKHKDFFNSIKALWLQGCRTLGISKIATTDTADLHSTRVYNVRQADGLSQGLLDMNREFSSTLDQDNPLSSRYLRVFPRATTFGWTKTAPGEEAHSELSIPFHIAHMAQINDDRKQFFDDPTSQFSDRSALKYAEAVLAILKQVNADDLDCTQIEKDAIDAWIDHGNFQKVRRYAFNNPDISAYQSLASGQYGELWQAKSLECILKNDNSDELLLSSVKEILADPFLIGYTFNSVYELLLRAKNNGRFDLYEKLQAMLLSSDSFTSFLMKKLASDELGIVRKIDYYVFFKEITNQDNPKIAEEINRSFAQLMARQSLQNGEIDYGLRDDQITLVQSMFKHKLIDSPHLSQILSQDIDSSVAMAIIAGLQQFPIDSSRDCFSKLLNHRNPEVVRAAAGAVGALPFPKEMKLELVKQMVEKNGDKAILALGLFITSSKCDLPNCSRELKTLTSSFSDKANISPIFGAMARLNIPEAESIYLNFEQRLHNNENKQSYVSSVLRSPSVSSNFKIETFGRIYREDETVSPEAFSSLSSLSGLDESHLSLFDQLAKKCPPKQASAIVELLSKSTFRSEIYQDRFTDLLERFGSNPNAAEKMGIELLSSSRLPRELRFDLWKRLLGQQGLGDLQIYNLSSKIVEFNHLTSEEVDLLAQFHKRLKGKFFKSNFDELIMGAKVLDEQAKKTISTSN